MEKKKKNTRVRELILVGSLIMISLVCYGALRFYQNQTTRHAEAVVTVNGKEFGRYPLNKDTTVSIKGKKNAINKLAIKNGYADMVKADCKDKICVNHRKVNKNGETIVCLPNKVIVEIHSSEDSKDVVDASTN